MMGEREVAQEALFYDGVVRPNALLIKQARVRASDVWPTQTRITVPLL